ncbi:methyl-accepting chemotaxis protein [Parvularcula sp. LCG005]|uniref:methyl-accepting chemotaxis protein n=1 Tax=Parvularcula sp. LCG005 TaxID=3078805 RepID=UPI002942FFD4|nr:methyl-accepting chemotaxis protein [Parvularcula sp. LCG005]WOI53490.1 methyl-accepting chemotaxis protein [Parvularcula sp. LCG005]
MSKSLLFRLVSVLSVLLVGGLAVLITFQAGLVGRMESRSAAQSFAEKSYLVASQMRGGIKWHKEDSIERAYASLTGKDAASNLSDVLVVSGDGTVLDTYASDLYENTSLSALLGQARSDLSSTEMVSYTDPGHYMTFVKISDPNKGTVLGYVGVAWSNAASKAAVSNVRNQTIGFGIAFVAIVLGAMFFVLLKMAIKPIIGLQKSMTELAQGNLAVEVPSTQRQDEIGSMAKTVEVFRENANRIEILHQEKLEAERAEREETARREEAERAREDEKRAELERKAEEERRREEKEREREAAAMEEQRVRSEQQAQVVENLARGLKSLASGDLTHRISTPFTSEYEQLRVDFNSAISGLEQAVNAIIGNAGNIDATVRNISSAADNLSKRTANQAATLEETAAALDEVTEAVNETAQGANHANKAVGSARQMAEESDVIVKRAVEAMGNIEASSSEVSKILGVIDEIAFQTNLLALNAGVEAARAGDAGQGFAVIATEVRALARRSSDAAKEINELISSSSKQVGIGVELVGNAGGSLSKIMGSVKEVSELVSKIAVSAQEQARGLSEVNNSINQMDQATQQNAAMVEESTATSHALSEEASELVRCIAHFQTSEAKPAVRSSSPKPKVVEQQRQIAQFAASASHGSAALKHATDPDDWSDF